MSEPRNQFTFYRSFLDAIMGLPKKDRAATLLAICEYAIYEAEPPKMSTAATVAFELMRPVLDAARKKANSGKQGGSKPKANGKQNASKPKANGKQNGSKKEVEYEVEYEVEVEVEGNASPLTPRGEEGIVFLSDEQVNDLIARMGEDGFAEYVDKLAAFILKKGATVRNHYETLLKWWNDDAHIRTAMSRHGKNGLYQQHGGALSELDRAAVASALAEDGEEDG